LSVLYFPGAMLNRQVFLALARNGRASSSLRPFEVSSLKSAANVRSFFSTARPAALSSRCPQSSLILAMQSPAFPWSSSSVASAKRSFAGSTDPYADALNQKSVVAQTAGGKTVERPISPHVTIYSMPLTAVTSITHRLTGIGLSAGFGLLAWLALLGSCDIPAYIAAFQSAAPLLVYPTKLIVSFPLAYHYTVGIRHLLWDKTAEGLSLDEVEQSNKIIIGVAATLTLFFTFWSF